MAFIDPLHPAQSAILSVLSRRKGLTIAELHRMIRSDHQVKISLPNLYRTVSQLIDVQMLVRNKGKISLNLVWIPHLLEFAENARATYVRTSEDILALPLAENERREFFADSLMGLDPVWFHVLLALTEVAPDQDWYIYNAHPWYSLGMRETEARGYQSLAATGVRCHFLYGNDTFLDRYGDKLIRVDGVRTYIAKGDVPFPLEGFVIWACGDYILECVFPEAVSRHFAFFFKTVQSVEQFDPELFADVFRMKARCKITVRRNAKEAERIRRTLREICERSA